MSTAPATPACMGHAELFDSTHPADHARAAAICRTCPAADWCADQLRAAHRAAAAPGPYPDTGPTGTWAGRLVGKKPGTGRYRSADPASEEAAFPQPEARRAHAAWVRGDRTPWAETGERVYQRRRDRARRQRGGDAA